MTYITADDLARRARLQAAIDKRDAERGRPLTDRERIQNLLQSALIKHGFIEHAPDCAVHLDSDRKCNCGVFH